jgi:MFS transporter, FSR family, fosmidomycin resistance protein
MTVTTSTRVSTTLYPILFAVSTCHLINDSMQATMLSVYPLLRENFALTFAQVGLMTFVFQVTASILQPLIGHFTDRKPWPWVLPFGAMFTLLGFVLLGTAHGYTQLIMGAGAIGIGSSIFHPDSSRVARLASGGRYGLAQSVFQVGGNIGTSIGPLFAAALILPNGQGSLFWFAGLAVLSVVILSQVSRWYAGHLGNVNTKPTAPAVIGKHVWPILALLVVLMFSKFVYMSSMHSFYNFYLIEHFGLSPHTAQLCLFAFLGSVAVGTFAGGPIGDRIGRKTVILFSILGTLPFALALPYANLFWTIALTIPIGLILSSAFPAIVVYAQELMPGRVGMISGLFFGLAFGSGGMGAAVLGAVADHTSIEFVFKICAFLPALGLLAFLLPDTKPAQKPA